MSELLDVTVHLATIDDLTAEHEALLDPVESARARRYRHPDDVRRFALGAALLRLATGAALAVDPARVRLDRTCDTCDQQHGRPRVLASTLACSVSHSGDLVCVALATEGRIGVDVETRRGLDHAALHDQLLAPGEPEPRDLGEFMGVWTRKEALLKATGDGLRRPMTSVGLVAGVPGVPGARVVGLDLGPDAWGALAVLDGRTPRVRLRGRWPTGAATARRAPPPSPPRG